MSTLQISLPEQVKAVVDEQMATGRFASESEYLCQLVEEDQRRRARAQLESLLVSRVTGTATVNMDAADWANMRAEFHRRRTAESTK